MRQPRIDRRRQDWRNLGKFPTWSFRLLIALSVAWAVSSTALSQQAGGGKFAFLVGVGTYRHANLGNLEFAENDVEDLDALLRAQHYTTLLMTTHLGKTQPDREPTRPKIQSALNAFLKANSPTKDDVIVVGLAGHGIQPLHSDDSFFCPVDANPTIKEVTAADASKNVPANPETLVRIGDILKVLDDSGVGNRFLLVDAC